MSYLPLEQYQRKWIFTHQSMPVPEQDLEQIKPMSPMRAAQFWKENLSLKARMQSALAHRTGQAKPATGAMKWIG